ncbi:sulfoxide reductase heme-binding subunit YedZ [Myxococcota bacterium]|nr:sulfoxide reductase heme-binding subunit YedZ [Myxococcota bacterium]
MAVQWPASRRLQTSVVAVGLLPALALMTRAIRGTLGANPVEAITHETGEWALRLLLLTLAVTPARRLFSLRRIAPLRRSLGLLTFGYACSHFLAYLVLDHFFDWQAIFEDVLERRYVTVGFLGFLAMVPLALTSTNRMARRLGRHWKMLHRLSYVAAACGVLHFLWLVKADLREPLIYAGVLAVLMGARIWFWRFRKSP